MHCITYLKAHVCHSTSALYELTWRENIGNHSTKAKKHLQVAIDIIEAKQLQACGHFLLARTRHEALNMVRKIQKCHRVIRCLKSIRDNPLDSIQRLDEYLIYHRNTMVEPFRLKNYSSPDRSGYGEPLLKRGNTV
ncbi:hypothetical protein [Erwinia sp. V71]|uniref:hypothetical protein n=1 Tax=Erwinia sp. V71 TaxID=3369424 RepID=UPI003F62B3FD